jgi:hypothetical protein
MPQIPVGEVFAKNPSNNLVPLNVDATGDLFTATGAKSVLNITAATVVKATPGRLVKISVTTAGAAGTANDCITTGAAAAANLIAAIPAAVGVISLDWPCAVGITITPGAAQVISVSYT